LRTWRPSAASSERSPCPGRVDLTRKIGGNHPGTSSLRGRDAYRMRLASCARDFTSSFRNTFRRWYSTVLALMNS
jgi:hypothetical protein